MKVNSPVRFVTLLLLLLPLSLNAAPAQTAAGTAQTGSGTLRGQVTDPSGAAITGATVVMTPSAGSPVTMQTNAQGVYEFKSLAPGKYSLTVVAQGFTLYENDNVAIADQPLRLNVAMAIEVAAQKVQVSDTAPTVDVNPANNAGSISITGKELEALPDDPDELESDLEALAGPSAGPNGGQMYIDGFTAGQLPPKSSIREIRINQNPFSSEYDKLGYGRIEIFTKPGTDKLHGEVFVDGNDSPFNAPNPFAGTVPPYYSTQFNGSIGGPINKNASFFFDAQRRNINEISAINAIVLDPALEGVPEIGSIGNPRHRTNLGPRIDWAITKNNTLTARYQYWRDNEDGDLGSQLNLSSQAYHSLETEDTVQISDTQVIGSKIINETRFQYNRDNSIQSPSDTNPAVNVFGNFTGGGNGSGNYNDLQNNYEVQNYTSLIHSNHVFKFGVRLRATGETDYSTSGFNGTFTFSALTGQPNLTNCLGQLSPCPVSLAFALNQIQHPTDNGGAPPYATQLTYTTGSPTAAITYYDFEPYFQDDWRVRPNITLSAGLRFETQNHIHDRADWAPRLGFAWGVGGRSKPPKVVIRGGYGIFYDRFKDENILQADLLNGVTQQQFIINNPTCFPGLDVALKSFSGCGTPTASASNIYQISPRLHAPYTTQGAISVERQITKSATLAVTYLSSRGFDQFLTINANAPYPGTPCAQPGLPACAPVTGGNIYRYVSEGNFNQNQLMMNTNIRVGARVQLFGYYSLNSAKSDTSGASSFASNSYDISQDYGRGSFDIRDRLFLGGSISLPYLLRLSPFMVFSSGMPFNITSPIDLNGDQVYDDRPSLVSTARCATTAVSGTQNNIYCTPLGTFDALATTGKLLPINYGTGPSHFVLNLRLTKTFGFGPEAKAGQGGGGGGGGGHHHGGPLFGGGPSFSSANSDRRYNLLIGVSVRNVFNNVNVALPNSVLGSRLFDVSNALQGGPFSPGSAANRRLDLQATFNF